MSTGSAPQPEAAAALRLISRGTSCSDVAAVMGVDPDDVIELGHAAIVHAAGGTADALTEGERRRVTGWLMGESETEQLVVGSPAARAFAEAATERLAAESDVQLRPLPAAGSAATKVDVPAPAAAGRQPAPAPRKHAKAFTADGDAPAASARSNAAPSLRGLALGGVIALAMTLLVLALTGVFDGGGSDSAGTGSGGGRPASTTTPTGKGAAGGWTLTKRYDLTPVIGFTGQGIGALEERGSAHILLVAGTRMPANSVVGIWLTGGPSPALIGFQKVTSKGEFSAIGPLPSGAPSAKRLIVTAENVSSRSAPPSTPGRVLLSSPFSL